MCVCVRERERQIVSVCERERQIDSVCCEREKERGTDRQTVRDR